ncbi:MAG TPA: TonB-dependent receptor, partial [Chitinophagaceae bacterium]|nr:TonB-dependent receptor [Chitinophagaceae bacterium]
MKNAFALTNFNSFSNVQWRQPLGKGWKLNASAAISFNNDLINSQLQNQQNAVVNNTGIPVLDAQNFNLRVTNTMWQVRGVLEKKFGAINAVRFGGELWKHTDSNSTRVFSSRFGGITNETYVAGFAESDLYITNELAFRPGLRMERSDLLNKINIAPRAS